MEILPVRGYGAQIVKNGIRPREARRRPPQPAGNSLEVLPMRFISIGSSDLDRRYYRWNETTTSRG
jgi:hypothetical protein